ncbi:MAG: hypothetical protein OWQ50_00565 [Acidianus infernus]|nr:hypothetical protein [Acidianus infernus]
MMTNCLEILRRHGYNLAGYSADTLILLEEKEGSEEECQAYLSYLEATYG